MTDIKVSIIIPVYNVEKYLKKCLSSAINQTLKDIEIICINDGSTDNSRNILMEYAKNDSRIVIIDKKNSGLGAARNTGIEHSNGEYILFLDSDDWLDLKACESLYYHVISEKHDLVFFKVKPYDENKDEFFERKDYELIAVKNFFNQSNVNYKMLKNSIFRISVVAYNRIYKKSFLDKYSMKFPERLIFEDNPFFFDVILKADKIKFLDEYYLYRRFRDDSIITSCDTRFLDIITISNLVIEVFRKNSLYNQYLEPLLNKKIAMIITFYKKINEDYKNVFFKAIQDDFNIIKNDNLLNEQFRENLSKKNLCFYLNALKSNSSSEFDILNLTSNLKVDIDNLKIDIKSIKKENKTLKKEIKTLKKEKKNFKKEKKALKKENEILKQKINEIESSNSWKITKPLRKFTNSFKK